MKKEKKGSLYEAKMILNKFTDDNVVEIYSLLLKQPHYVTDIQIKLRQEQSITSQHLKKMRTIGIVSTDKTGKFIHYSIEPVRYAEIETWAKKIVEIYSKALPTLIVPTHKEAETAYNILQDLWTTQPIVEFLLKAKKAHKVGSIYGKLKIEQSICSQSLSKLLDIGIVSVVQDGKYRYYTIDKEKYINIINEINLFLQ